MLYPAKGTILAPKAIWVLVKAVFFMSDKFVRKYEKAVKP
jgi:hypothetical protein